MKTANSQRLKAAFKDYPREWTNMAFPLRAAASPRRIYGIGVSILGTGNVSYGVGQYVGGSQLPVVSLLQLVMGTTLVVIGGLVIAGSDRLSPPDLSDRALLAIGTVGGLVGVYMTVAGAVVLG